ncbi:MAG: LPS translocon maturation chaperone LptM [Pseudolabrys sp.]
MSEFRRPLSRLAVAAAMAALLVLGGCGRKGPLDPPPGASVAGEPAPQTGGGLLTPMSAPIGSHGGTSSAPAAIGADGRPVAPKGPDRPFVLDGLLN